MGDNPDIREPGKKFSSAINTFLKMDVALGMRIVHLQWIILHTIFINGLQDGRLNYFNIKQNFWCLKQ